VVGVGRSQHNVPYIRCRLAATAADRGERVRAWVKEVVSGGPEPPTRWDLGLVEWGSRVLFGCAGWEEKETGHCELGGGLVPDSGGSGVAGVAVVAASARRMWKEGEGVHLAARFLWVHTEEGGQHGSDGRAWAGA
jgi:hypothetical protein